MFEYNVLTEPWLTAVDEGGGEHQYGLLDVVRNAHQLRGIIDASPAIQFGLYRILIAFTQDALELVHFEDLADVLEQGAFDTAVFESYAAQVGLNRFDLFDSETPFLQTAPTVDDDKKLKSVVELFYHFPGGSNVLHFSHVQAAEHAVAPDVAARALCSIAPFMMSGGAGYSPSVNGTPPWYLLAVGENLFQTIVLNCCTMEIGGLEWDVPPAWAADDVLEPRVEKAARSLAEGLTWQPRQVRLLLSEGGTCTYSGGSSSRLVRQIVWGPGHKFGGHETWLDPHVAYTLDARRGPLPLRPRADRQLWRDYGPLFLREDREQGKDMYSRPVIVRQLQQLKSAELVANDVAELFEVYGMRVDKAKVFEWQHEHMPLQTSVLENPEAAPQVTHALGLAEDIARGLYRAIKRQYPRGSRTNTKALDGIIRRAQTSFWDALGAEFQTNYLSALSQQRRADEVARDNLLVQWATALRKTGWECFNDASRSIETGAKALENQVKARNAFAGTMSSVLGGILKRAEGGEDDG